MISWYLVSGTQVGGNSGTPTWVPAVDDATTTTGDLPVLTVATTRSVHTTPNVHSMTTSGVL